MRAYLLFWLLVLRVVSCAVVRAETRLVKADDARAVGVGVDARIDIYRVCCLFSTTWRLSFVHYDFLFFFAESDRCVLVPYRGSLTSTDSRTDRTSGVLRARARSPRDGCVVLRREIDWSAARPSVCLCARRPRFFLRIQCLRLRRRSREAASRSRRNARSMMGVGQRGTTLSVGDGARR